MRSWLNTSAGPGAIPAPKGEGEETAVPANSTPIAPFPVVESYVVVSLGTDELKISDLCVHKFKRICTSEVGYPVRMTVAGENESIADFIVIQMIEDSCTVCTISVPSVLNGFRF